MDIYKNVTKGNINTKTEKLWKLEKRNILKFQRENKRLKEFFHNLASGYICKYTFTYMYSSRFVTQYLWCVYKHLLMSLDRFEEKKKY